MRSPYRELKERAFSANQEIPRRGLAIYTFGNASAHDVARAVVAIKPSGVEYERLKVDDLVVLDLEGRVLEGTLRPSSDTPTHLVLYRAFSGLGGVVHTHSTYATSWAQARRPIPIYGTTHADHLPEDVPCTAVMTDEAVERDYEVETGKQILECFRSRDPLHTPMVLVAGHGPFTWGETAEKAVYHAAVLEELARMAYLTHSLDPGAARLPESLVHKHFERKHGKNAYYGQSSGDR
ncbi:MAG TPA: L-ribulose-5-phosphate 4-epimerase [Anaeromyxobacter sp.]|nr:L-ribulose-5-phosphate 4-epimerase [Anaeromyxobacter sp.]